MNKFRFSQHKLPRLVSKGGFTLLEILVVLGILGALIAVGGPKLRSRENSIKKVAREFAVLSREVRNQARLKGTTHRLVMQFDDKEPKYWIESANGPVLLSQKPEIPQDQNSDSEESKKPPAFQKTTNILKKERQLPSGFFFGQLESIYRKDPITSGTGYIYFSPEGLVERSALQVTDRKDKTWTIFFNPLTGHADIIEKAGSLRDNLE